MKVVKVAEAKSRLSRYLQYVRRGGRVRIYDRDTPVADLIPVEPRPGEEQDEDEQLLLGLERRGVLRRGQAGPIPPELLHRGPDGGRAHVVEALLEERRQGR